MDIFSQLKKTIHNNNLEEVKAILDNNILHLDSEWADYILLKNVLQQGQKNIAKLLIEKGFRVNRSTQAYVASTPLHLAVNLSCPEMTKFLLNNGASINKRNENYLTPLLLAVKKGNNLLVDLMLEKVLHQNISNEEGLSHMHVACMRNRVDVVKKLLQSGAQINHAVKKDSLFWSGYTSLHFAVHFQSIETVRFLIDNGANISAKDIKGLTPLHLAADACNEEIIDLILAAHNYNTTNPTNSKGLSHFHIACMRNNPKIVEGFLQLGVNVNLQVSEKSINWPRYSPLNFAIVYECVDVIKLLISHNADLRLVTQLIAYRTENTEIKDILSHSGDKRHLSIVQYRRPSDFHIACLSNNLNAVQSLIEQGVSINSSVSIDSPILSGCTPLHLAVQQKNKEIVELLLKHGADITIRDGRNKTPLHVAFEANQTEIINYILSVQNSAKINPVDDNGLTQFHIFCANNKLCLLKSLIENGVDVNHSVNSDSPLWPDYTPLHFAVKFNNLSVVKLLLSYNADIRRKNGIGLTPLELAIKATKTDFCEKWRNIEIIKKLLLAYDHQKIDFVPSMGLSIFHIVSMEDDIKAVESFYNPSLINKAVESNVPRCGGYTPLHFAVNNDCENVVKWLLDHGADPTIQDANGNTPLHLSETDYSTEGKEIDHRLILPNNPISEYSGYSHFHVICKVADIETVKYALSLGFDVNQTVKEKVCTYHADQTPLHIALSRCSECDPLIKLLLKSGADVNARDEGMNTPLHFIHFKHDDKAAELLLSAGADVNVQNIFGQTALHTVINEMCFIDDESDTVDKINVLLRNDADVNIEDEHGLTPLMLLANSNNILYELEIIITLLKHIRKLIIIGYQVSKKNLKCYIELVRICEGENAFNELTFAKDCISELEHMILVKVSNFITLHDIFFEDCNAMAVHIQNDKFKEIVDAADFKSTYPIYGYLLKLQFKKGLERRKLLELSKPALKLLLLQSESLLPALCADKILSYLDNEHLLNLISIGDIGSSQETADLSHKKSSNTSESVLTVNKSPCKRMPLSNLEDEFSAKRRRLK